MPVQVSYPGVYVTEAPGSTNAISGVTTADTGFVDVFLRGPAGMPVRITDFGQFTSVFGGLSRKSRASYGIYQFFLNGGATAWVVRVAGPKAVGATLKLTGFGLVASGPGTWANYLQAAMQNNGTGFDLVIREVAAPGASNQGVVATEVYRGLSLDPDDPNFVTTVLATQSMLAAIDGSVALGQPSTTPAPTPSAAQSITSSANMYNAASASFAAFAGGVDDLTTSPDQIGMAGDSGTGTAATGVYLFDSIAPFVVNLLCLPMMSTFDSSAWANAYANAYSYCEPRRVFLLVDVPNSWDDDNEMTQLKNVQAWFEGANSEPVTNSTDHAAVYYPRLSIPDPLGNGLPMKTENSGTLAGLYARTDGARGVWKAPAGTLATLNGVLAPLAKIGDIDNGTLNELGINVIRSRPVIGTVAWGARTVRGADMLASEWKYVNVRRLALYIEQSLLQGTAWAVFEPNDEPLWSSLRLSIGSFMNGLYKQGAFAGSSAKDAYFVQCDATTTTSVDQQLGRVNVSVGFAPLYPAEFVVLTISQIQS